MRNNRKQQTRLRNRRNSNNDLPRTKSASLIPTLNSLRGKSKLAHLQNAGKRTLFSYRGRVRAVLPDIPKFKMIPIVKSLIDAKEPDIFTSNCLILIKKFAHGKAVSSSTTIFRDNRFSALMTIDDGHLCMDRSVSRDRSKSVLFGATSKSKRQPRKDSAGSQGSSDSSRSRNMREISNEYALSTLLDIKMNKAKANQFSLFFYNKHSAKACGDNSNNWQDIPNMTQMSIKCENEEEANSFITALLTHVQYVTHYNESLIATFETDLANGNRDLENEKDIKIQKNMENLTRLNMDLNFLVFGKSLKVVNDMNNFVSYLQKNTDAFEEAGFWKERAVLVSSIPQEEDALTKIQRKFCEECV